MISLLIDVGTLLLAVVGGAAIDPLPREPREPGRSRSADSADTGGSAFRLRFRWCFYDMLLRGFAPPLANDDCKLVIVAARERSG